MSTERGVEMPQEYREAFQLAELIAIHLLVKSGNKYNEIENMVRRNVFEEPTLSHLGMLVNCTVFVGDSSCVCITIIFSHWTERTVSSIYGTNIIMQPQKFNAL